MKKSNSISIRNVNIFKFDLKMKLTAILLLCSLFQVSANTYSQNTKLSLNLKNVSMEKVLNEIEKNSEFNFFYENAKIDLSRISNFKFNKKRINEILFSILKDSNIKFQVFNKQIILLPKTKDLENEDVGIKQQTSIEGTILDINDNPLPGATIVLKGTRRATSTDFDGKFKLTLKEGYSTIVVSYVGYKSKEVLLNNQKSNYVIRLVEDNETLSEIVIIGYGKVKREALTGSVGTVDIKNITSQAPTVNLDNALQGQVAGVYVSSANGQPGAAARIRIRGTTSLFGSNQPLYVIDGIPVAPNSNIAVGAREGRNLDTQLAQQGLSTPLGNINSADIESISILKDASAAAIYGSRAANGVIIINTKQGVYSGKPQFNVNSSISTQSLKTLDVLNAAQYRSVWTTAVKNGVSTDAYSQSVLDGSHFGAADTNWEDEVSPSKPLTKTFDINVYGGSEKTRYYSSLGVNTQDGIYEGAKFDRYSYKLNLNTEVSKRWKFGSQINVSFTDQVSKDGGITQATYSFRPDLPVFNQDGGYSFSTTSNFNNPVALTKAKNSNKTLLLLGSFFTELKINESLTAKSMISLNYNSGNQVSFYPKFTSRGGWSRINGDGDGYAQESRSTSTNTVWDNTLNFNKTLNDLHSINAVMGLSFEKAKSSYTKAFGEGFFNDVLTNVSSATIFTSGSASASGSGLRSYFGRVNYDFDNKYFLTFSARLDGSSKFAKNNQNAFFSAFAGAWRISEEKFLEDVDFINELKLKTSFGKTGQQDFSAYQWRTLFETSNYGGDPSIILSQLGNDDLKWETTNQFDLGLDFAFLNRRITGEIGYYTKNTTDALFTAKAPGSSATRTVIANVGDTQNSGIEFTIKGDIIRNNDFTWSVGFNMSKNSNKLTKIADDFKDKEGFLTGFGGGGRLREGSPIGLIYGYVSEGIFQNQEEIDVLNAASSTGAYQHALTSPGDLKFRDLTGPNGVPDGRITNLDQEIIGDTQPDFFGGINSTFSYKGFSLSTIFSYSVGNDIQSFNYARDTNFFSTFFGENKVTRVLDAWTPKNTNTNIPRAVYRDPNQNGRISSHYVYKGSFLRLKTVNVNYSFSKKLLEKIKFVDNVSVYFTAQNLLTFTNYPGADPEASNLYNNDISSGRDNNRYPIAKVFTTGVRIGF